MSNGKEIRADILRQYRSIHAFCRKHPEIGRSTVYQVLSGKYPGNRQEQIRRIRFVLDAAPDEAERSPVEAEDVRRVLQDHKCAHCRILHNPPCGDCRKQTAREAEAVAGYYRRS